MRGGVVFRQIDPSAHLGSVSEDAENGNSVHAEARRGTARRGELRTAAAKRGSNGPRGLFPPRHAEERQKCSKIKIKKMNKNLI